MKLEFFSIQEINNQITCERKKPRPLFKARFTFHLHAREKREKRRRETISRVTTRAQKRRMGERDDLWGVIVDNDDICFKHILPRLNRTDLKFLYDVNSETRALIKRSSRKDELEKRFEVKQMSSISTLEIAWENQSSWRDGMYEKSFCSKVAGTNKLELLRWIREEKNCGWDSWTFSVAAEGGNMEMVKYCAANHCPIDEDACENAAEGGHLEILKYLRKEVKAPWDSQIAERAAEQGHLHILKYLVKRKFFVARKREYDGFDGGYVCWLAAENGHLDCLKCVHEDAKLPLDSTIADVAAEYGHLHILEYLVDCGYNKFHADACATVTKNGRLDCLKCLHEDAKVPLDSRIADVAAEYGHLHILEYLVDCGYNKFHADACAAATKYGHLDCLKYLHETAKAPWDAKAVYVAYSNNRSECLQYLLNNGCPLPEGWRYEDGTLSKYLILKQF